MDLTIEADSMDQLIADCAQIPDELNAGVPHQSPVSPAAWHVDEACHAQVAELDEYV